MDEDETESPEIDERQGGEGVLSLVGDLPGKKANQGRDGGAHEQGGAVLFAEFSSLAEFALQLRRASHRLSDVAPERLFKGGRVQLHLPPSRSWRNISSSTLCLSLACCRNWSSVSKARTSPRWMTQTRS